jgi:hypothetical protein
MVCFRCISVNTQHKGENKDNNNNNNNNLRDLGFKNVDGLTKPRFAHRIL